MDSHAFLLNLAAFLGTAVIAVPLFQRIGLGSVLGFLAAGSLLGPWGIRLITDVKSILSFAELGVVLLLFVIGLELKPSRLWVMRRTVFGSGGAQVALTTLVLAVIGHFLGLSPAAAFVAGLGLSLSSTAFALQILSERGQLNTISGRVSFAILLFQDMAVIPLLGLIPLLGGAEAAVSATSFALGTLKVVAVIAGIGVGGRFLLRPLFRMVAKTRMKEVFTAAALLVVVGTGLLMEAVGMSMALGTFLAGVLLADSEFRHEIETDIDPFKGLLLGLFFMAVGMSVDYGLILSQPLTVFGLVLGFMAIKIAITYGLGRRTGLNPESARNLAFVLPQGGEFAFVLFAVASQSGVMPVPLANLLVVVVTVSMALSPILFSVNETYFCYRKQKQASAPFDTLPSEANPIIIAGFGRVGQIVGRLLRVQGIKYTALELDSEQVELVRRFGTEIYYGDASRLDLLEMAGAKTAKAFVLAIDDIESSVKTAKVVREHFPHLKIFARARNRAHVYELMNLGVTLISRETFGSSLEMARDLLVDLGVETSKAERMVAKFRDHDEKTLQGQYEIHGDEKKMIAFNRQAVAQLADLFRADQT